MAELSVQQLTHLAFEHHREGRLREAEKLYQQILAIEPRHPGALHQLAGIAYEEKNYERAIDLFMQALQLKPNWPQACVNLALALKDNAELDAAIEVYRHAIALKADNAPAHKGLVGALIANGKPQEAIVALERTLELQPDDAEVHNHFGIVSFDIGKTQQAIAAFQRAIQIKPDLAEAHHNLGMAFLAAGDFRQGWAECEWRWHLKLFTRRPSDFSRPQWKGEDLKDRTILLYVEQGFGDVIQFVRYIPLLARRGAKIILAGRPELKRLLASMTEIHRLIDLDEKISGCDFHCPLLSLPLAFNTDLANIPREVPYLWPSSADVQSWREKLADGEGKLRVGLCWAGAPGHHNDRNRSIPLNQLSALADVPGVIFYKLQKENRLEDSTFPLINLTPGLRDFADTAAMIANLDLVISVDTSVAHLAGAMGKPVWTLLPFAADWRWLLDRDDSPWYPTMQLFRQDKPGDWSGAIARVTQSLQKMTAKPSRRD